MHFRLSKQCYFNFAYIIKIAKIILSQLAKDNLAYISTIFLDGFLVSILSCVEKSGQQSELTFVQFGPQDQKLSYFW